MNSLKTFLPYLFGNKEGKSFELPKAIDWEKLSFEESLMFHTLQNDLETFAQSLDLNILTSQQVFHLLSFQKYLSHDAVKKLRESFPKEDELFTLAKKGEELSPKSVQELLDHKNYKLSLFAIFRKDRTKPGRIFIRDSDGRFIHGQKGEVWSVPALGTSGRGLPFNHSNGTTPCGVYSIDSVMPEANKNHEFGKFRRLIVNFLPKSPHEENILQFLPKNHHTRRWWLPCLVGRELGRSLLRIHGTGRVNKNPLSPYYPMIPSSGCLTTTERSFLGRFHINHQRELLDTVMRAQGLIPCYENESKIHGLLYVIDFDGTYQALEFKS